MPCKRTASDAELGAPDDDGEPVLIDDVLGVIFSFCVSGWGVASCAHARGGDVCLGALETMRLVCKQWARAAGPLVSRLCIPPFGSGEVAIPAAFPRVAHISTGALVMSARRRSVLEGVLARYAALGVRLCVVDDRLSYAFDRMPIDAHGHYGRGNSRNPAVHSLVNTAFPFPLWLSSSRPRRLCATFGVSIKPQNIVERWDCHHIALAQADVVKFITLELPIVGDGFRARTVCLDHGTIFGSRTLVQRFPPEHVRALLDPARWIDRRLPTLCVLAPAAPRVSRGLDAIRLLMATVAPLPVVVYVLFAEEYAGCGFPVYPHALFQDEFQ